MSVTEAVGNSIVFNSSNLGIILSGANAFGKSTLLRSVAACCVLRNAGLCGPWDSCRGTGFQNVFLKIGNTDDASRKLSSFANECLELAGALQVGQGDRSLYLFDEVMRGTATTEGAALTGALSEHLEANGHASIISTHFRELFDMDLKLERTTYMKMQTGPRGEKTFKLTAGQCNDTRAFETAITCNLDAAIVQRASEIAKVFEPTDRDDTDSEDYTLLVPRAICSISGSASEDVGIIYGNDEVPPSVSACLYAIVQPTHIYVGETANLSQRSEEHRASGMLPRKSTSRLYYISVANKSMGRELETRLQRRLADMGVAQVSVADSTHLNF